MKRLLFIFVLFSFFLCAFVPAFAIDWPPKNYEMPRTVLTPNIVGAALSGLFSSIKAVGNTGLLITGITLSVSLIGTIFKVLFLDKIMVLRGVRRNEFRRAVSAADRERNLDAIIDNKVAEMEVNRKARLIYRLRNPDADFEERLYQRELAFSVDQEFQRLHPGLALDRALHHREISLQATEIFRQRHPDLDVDSAVYRREVSHQAAAIYRDKHPGEDMEDAIYRYDLNRKARDEYWKRKTL